MAGYHSPKIVTEGLLVYFDGGNPKSYPRTGTNWQNIAGGANNAVLTNGPTYSTENGGSLVFDGTNDYADVGSSASILSSTTYTKMAFVYPTSHSTSNNIISGGNTGQHAFWLAGGNKFQAGHNGNWSIVVSNSTVPLNTWTFGATTYSSTSGWEIYHNGRREATSVTNTTFTGTGNIFIGSYGAASNTFTGRISCVVVYNRVLSQDEILQNYDVLRSRFGL